MNVLICLLSDQMLPNVLSVHLCRPDKLVLVETPAMRKGNAAQLLMESLTLRGLRGIPHEIVPIEAADDVRSIQSALHGVLDAHPGATWWVNVTGGTKPMSIAAFDLFRNRAKALWYADVRRPNRFVDLRTGAESVTDHQLSVEEFLCAYGVKIHNRPTKLEQARERARQWYPCSRVIGRCQPDFVCFDVADRRGEVRKHGGQVAPSDFAQPLLPEVADALAATFGLQRDEGAVSGQVDKYAADFLSGGWLEVLVWGVLDALGDDLDITDLHIGLNISAASASNELDVAFIRDYTLHIVECKSGGQRHDPGFDVLYKIDSVTKNLRALRARSYVASVAPHVLDTDGNLKPSISSRAERYGCRVLTAPEIQRLAAAESADVVKEVFGWR